MSKTKIPEPTGTKIDEILKQVLHLKGGSQDPEGQEVMGCLATAEGIYFRCKVKCPCGKSLGFVKVVEDVAVAIGLLVFVLVMRHDGVDR